MRQLLLIFIFCFFASACAKAQCDLIVTNPAPVCSPNKVDLTSVAITAGSTAGMTFTYWTNAIATASLLQPNSVAAGTYYIVGTTGTCSDTGAVTATVY